MKDYKYYFELLEVMISREIRVRYKKAMFGLLWIFINPLLQMIVIGYIFSYFINIPDYFIFLFCGLLPWNFFTASLTKATSSFFNERSLLKKAKFSIEIIPISIILSNLFHFLVASALFILTLVLMGHINNINVLLFGITVLWLTCLTTGIVLLTSTLYVKFSDVSFVMQTLITVLFYASPIIYKLDMVPKEVLPYFYLNPFTSIFQMFQCSLVGLCSFNNALIVANVIVGIILVSLGIFIFNIHKNYLVDWL